MKNATTQKTPPPAGGKSITMTGSQTNIDIEMINTHGLLLVCIHNHGTNVLA